MSALSNERGPQRVRFFDWLIKEINSGNYEGLCWLDNENHTTFRIPWKHNSRKSLVASDYKIFQAWALVSGKYVEAFPDPAKWKTNFRCALKSTKRFELVSESKDPDPHHVYRICPLTVTAANPPADTDHRSDHEDDQLHVSPYSAQLPSICQPTHQIQQEIDVAFETLSLGNPVPVLNGNTSENFYQCSHGDAVQWPVHHLPPDKSPSLNLGEIQHAAWVLNPLGGSDNLTAVSATFEPDHSYVIRHVEQNGCLPLANERLNGQVEDHYSMWSAQTTANVNSQSAAIHPLQHMQQDSRGTNQFNLGETPYNCFIENVFINEEAQRYLVEMNNPTRNDCWLPMNEPAVAEQDMFVSPTVPSPKDQLFLIAPLQNNTGILSLNLDVSIYYRGKLLDERHVDASTCMFAYDNHPGSTLDGKDAQIVKFPNPETLPDQKQVMLTLTLLQSANLLLYQKNEKICAKRHGRCKVFLAFSKQLENVDQDPQSRLLPRNEETEIFNYGKFLKELKDFRENHCGSSPDYTIYLCFGQCFSSAKPKESKLILVKLVPKICKSLHEQAQKEGASSLSENLSLQISNSLPDMIEEILSYCNMQMEN